MFYCSLSKDEPNELCKKFLPGHYNMSIDFFRDQVLTK